MTVGVLAPERISAYASAMQLIFDIDDRVRLPWRFFGRERLLCADR